MKNKILIKIIIIALALSGGCGQPYQEKDERPIVLEDRDEAALITTYLNHGYLDYEIMKGVFFDLYLIRVLFAEDIPCLNWSRFIPPEQLPATDPKYSRQIDRCMIYPRQIEEGTSYLFEDEWVNEKNERITIYYYFECHSGGVEFIGDYDTRRHRFPEWWTEADSNLRLYESKR
ncbi:MAG: hypothetical protein GF417_08445 [Candidatus Latescibacteria bacterium]|nr:hypothetical protein [bacterium]MBD3424450.1 hypothetical protein [Candidatus Latescibacterota bacterium]